ncbi:MAG: GTPase, partial [Planctomycetota bacterium]
MTPLRVAPLTPRAAGAVALLHLAGPAETLTDTLNRLTGSDDWADVPISHPRLARLADLDDGLVTRLSPTLAQLTPHGGVALLDAILDRLRGLGVTPGPRIEPALAFPEADSPIEADVLATLATAESPAAIPVLAAQPAIWRRWLADPDRTTPSPQPSLDRLLTPPTVVLVGRPNVGKSTLTNALTARPTAITSPLAGTTRDHLAADTTLPLPNADRLAVRLLDTPGLRRSTDPIEQRAIAAARDVITRADCLVALRDPDTDWPDDNALPRPPDLRVLNKADLAHQATAPDTLAVSARTGEGLPELAAAIVTTLDIPDLTKPASVPPWPFCATLRDALADAAFDWSAYLDDLTPRP